MPEVFKTCPTCGTRNPGHASFCISCGNNINTIAAQIDDVQQQSFDYRYGETDLLEGSLNRTAGYFTIGIIAMLMMVIVGGIGLFILTNNTNNENAANVPEVIRTNTPRPTVNAATVTLGPPTNTPSQTPTQTFTPSVTPTRGPCTYTIPPGGSLYLAMTNCGHRDTDVLPTVLALNGLSNENSVQANQQVLIPWPTSTTDPNATPSATATIEGDADAGANNVLEVDESIVAFVDTPTPTLPAGVQWHRVNAGEDLYSIIVRYNADVKTLSELNREVDFARCEFGETFGGPNCIVLLFDGQLLRVPAPSPTPTLSPTPDPNATATPTPTPTVNVPNVVSPADREFFFANELVTLRWIPSATLRTGESYRVDVEDTTNGERYTALTTDLSLIVPPEWQGDDSLRHTYVWTVGIVETTDPETIRYRTNPVSFVWQGLSTEESTSS